MSVYCDNNRLSYSTDNIELNCSYTTSTHSVLFGKRKHLFIFRLVCLLYFTMDISITAYFKLFNTWFLSSLTCWQQLASFLWFSLVIIDWKFRLRQEKICKIVNLVKFSIDFLVFIFFFTIIGPYLFETEYQEPDFEFQYDDYGDFAWHILPFVTMLVDTLWNQHQFNIKHIWVSIVYLSCFGIVNAIYAWTHVKPVYDQILTWKDWWTLQFASIAVILVLCGTLLTVKCKKRWYNKKMKSMNSDYNIYQDIDIES